MRKLLLALATVGALAACNPSAENGASNADTSTGSVFPNLSGASYRAEATVTHENGQSMPLVMTRDGQKLRLEGAADGGDFVLITNGETGESLIMSTNSGRTFAMRATGTNMPFSDPSTNWSSEVAANATRTGTCSVAGETGAEWTRTDEAGVAKTACVTNDGIILRATEGGRTTWETTSVQRGPQSADLFQLPPGVQVMDLGNMGSALEDAMRRAKAAQGGQ